MAVAESDRARTAIGVLRALHASETPDPFEVLREELSKRLDRPKPANRMQHELMHLADAVTALAAQAEASRRLSE